METMEPLYTFIPQRLSICLLPIHMSSMEIYPELFNVAN